jgi:tetratricopeptide (TPR) repeat protein
MGSAQLKELLELEQWLGATRAGAARLLPDLLDLPASELGGEIERYPELRLGIIRLLISVAEEARKRFPVRAHELTSAIVEHAGVAVPPSRAVLARKVQAQAWCAHAGSLRSLGRYAEARHAIGLALDLYRQVLVSAWHMATAEVIEAQILHDQGERAEALQRIRRAAGDLLLHGDRERYVRARTKEAWMHWQAGDRAAFGGVWVDVAQLAVQRNDIVLVGLLNNSMGLFELRHGSAALAAGHFEQAHQALDVAGMRREAIGARRNLAEAAVARGRFHGAIFEYYKVQALLLAGGAVIDGAVVSAEILDLLLLTGRNDKVLPLAGLLLDKFGNAGLQENAMEAWVFVRQRALAGRLTGDDVAHVREYFRYLPVWPKARFTAPRGRS